MIVVDTSVWVAHMRNLEIEAVDKLRSIDEEDRIIVGDLILLEVLQGARDEKQAAATERSLRQFEVVSMLDGRLAAKTARNYRMLRGCGITVRKTIDMIIGTFCIERGHELLHDDRDFDPMVEYLGLRAA